MFDIRYVSDIYYFCKNILCRLKVAAYMSTRKNNKYVQLKKQIVPCLVSEKAT